MTHDLIIVNICAKQFQNTSNNEKYGLHTKIPNKNHIKLALTSKCGLDLGDKCPVVAHDTSSYYNKYLCQVIYISFDK
jgi:hypothetical protein